MNEYHSRTWLNNIESSFTGSIVCCCTYRFNDQNKDGEEVPYQFVEIADCQRKIRIHSDFHNPDKGMFINKLKIMRSEIDKFIEYLESE